MCAKERSTKISPSIVDSSWSLANQVTGRETKTSDRVCIVRVVSTQLIEISPDAKSHLNNNNNKIVFALLCPANTHLDSSAWALLTFYQSAETFLAP